eukprot:219308_1
METQLTGSTATSMKHFIPQSPVTNIKNKEISRWQQRQHTNTNQMNLLSNIESYFSEEPKIIHASKANKATKHTSSSSTNQKCFLRKGGGTVTQKNKYQIERERQAERKRMKQLGLSEAKPKTQKILLMEQWREKQKKKDKQSRKKKAPQPVTIEPPKTAKSSLHSIKLLKQKKMKHTLSAPHMEALEEKTQSPSDELQSASQFENLTPFEPQDNGVLVVAHESEGKEDEVAVGIWAKPKLPKKLNIAYKSQKGYNFARHSVLGERSSKKNASYPTYSHHHHTSLYGQHKKPKVISQHKKLFHKQATIHSMSKRDRLAAKYNDRKAAEPQINAEKAYAAKMEELQQTIGKYEEKIHDAQVMKQSSLEQFRKYQTLVQDKAGSLEQKQKEFEKYKKKQERILCQKTQEIDKRSRALLNIPDRKQRKQIEEMKKEIEGLKVEFVEKEKRYKSKIERLKKQNKKIVKEKRELQNEMKELEKERLEYEHEHKEKKQIRHKKTKRYSINKIDMNTRPKSHHGVIRRTSAPLASTVPVVLRRSTNNMYAQYDTMNEPVRVVSAQGYEEDETQYDSSSSESSSSDESEVNNGEDEAQKAKAVLVTNPNIQNVVQHDDGDENACHLPDVPPEYDPGKMSTEQINCESVKNTNNPLERMQHPDGKMEQVYGDGSKLILFPNQTEKYIFANLRMSEEEYKQVYVKFPNGDVKKILSDGTEVYYYSNNDIIHASKLDGIQLFYFASQHEVHFPDNTKHIMFADGTNKYIYANGDEQCVFPETAK